VEGTLTEDFLKHPHDTSIARKISGKILFFKRAFPFLNRTSRRLSTALQNPVRNAGQSDNSVPAAMEKPDQDAG
jgi:hypothetical protein